MVKIKNTLENKAKFFALYWGQKISCVRIDDGEDKKGFEVNLCDWKVIHEDAYLELKPLSAIAHEDAKHLGTTSLNIVKKSFNVSAKYMFYSEEADSLRSKGYAVPWMGLYVETMVEYGWIKLKT